MASLPAAIGLTLFTLLRLSPLPLALSTLPSLYTFFSAPSTPSILSTPTYFLGVSCLVIGTSSDLITLIALLRRKPNFDILLNLSPLVLFSASRVLFSYTPAALEGQPPPQAPRGCIILLNVIV
ncbi:hypothetical protein VE01_09633 [Pseudogymnoascus verrucosus]|uniref:Uncharacterized protein n=1 Tax=Pseudogymnoascus verrucosus TaxID=342668 RepID=A0A1B8G9U9_9PEZI|nr:uncharacterized protein VE01_09633 [Pseudogymnoascus verrucosus]OBT92613.1 hypothetical protein VE01_09633 [Pseudogymnoascus verrucosus]